MNSIGTLSNIKPADFWNWPFKVDNVTVINLTGSICYLNIGNNQIPGAANYGNLVPSGGAATFPAHGAQAFGASIAVPLLAGVAQVNATERVDFYFTSNPDTPPIVQAAQLVRNLLETYSFNLPAGADAGVVLDTRQARSLEIACAPATGGGLAAVDIEFSSAVGGPFNPYIAARLPSGAITNRYLVRSFPVLGPYTRIHVYEVSFVNPSAGTIYYSLSSDYVPDLNALIASAIRNNGSLAIGATFYYDRVHDSGTFDWVDIRINGAHAPFHYRFVLYTDSDLSGGLYQKSFDVHMISPFDPTPLDWQINTAPYRTFDPGGVSVQYHIPVNIHYQTNWRWYFSNIADAAPPSVYSLNFQIHSRW